MNKKKLFQNIIIGSGPSAVAGLMASLKESNGNNAIITGHLKSKLLLKKFNIHKKILFESDDDTKYLNNIFTNKSRLIFSISKVGGFGNFWGSRM